MLYTTQWSFIVTRSLSTRGFCTALKTSTWRTVTLLSSRSSRSERFWLISRGRRCRSSTTTIIMMKRMIFLDVGELITPWNRSLLLLDRPFCERSILCFAHVSFLFFPTHFFRRLQTDIFETFPHDVALLEKEALLCRFPKSAPNKNEGRKPPNFTQSRV